MHIRSYKSTLILYFRTITHSISDSSTVPRFSSAGFRWSLVSFQNLKVFLEKISGVLSSVISSAASLMVLSKIAKGEIIQSGYLKKHLGKLLFFLKILNFENFRLQTAGRSAHSKRIDARRPRICVISSLLCDQTTTKAHYQVQKTSFLTTFLKTTVPTYAHLYF